MKKLNYLILFIIIVTLVILYFNLNLYNNAESLKSEKIQNCNFVSQENSYSNSVEKLKSFSIQLKILNERKWKKTLINNQISYAKDNSFTYDAPYSEAEIIFDNQLGFKCTTKAKIKPHGDLKDHFVDYKTGLDEVYEIPSLKVKLVENNFFGIVEFRLFKPKTRNYNNEIVASSIFEDLGFLSPRTASVNIIYNKSSYPSIFQEKINKEFLENNKLVEGPIYSGDERFVFKYDELNQSKESGISKHKLANSEWIKDSSQNYEVSAEALEVLNTVNYFYYSDVPQYDLVDYYSSQKNGIYSKFFSQIPVFDAMISALGGQHSLSRDDRRFYYDSVNRVFMPIYYDGMVSLINTNNQFVPNNEKFDWSLNKIDDLEKKILRSASIGSKEALQRLEKINLETLLKKINKRGAEIKAKDLSSIIEVIRNNLILLSNSQNFVETDNKNQHPLKNAHAIKKNIKAKYLFKDNKNIFYICDLILESCLQKDLSPKNLKLALGQRLKTNDDYHVVYMGDKKNFETNKHSTKQLGNRFKTVQINNLSEIKYFGEVSVHVDRNFKTIKIIKKNSEGKVLLNNVKLDNWTIEFEDISEDTQSKPGRDANGLTGCINIYDSYVTNLSVYINRAKCEDAINFVRTEGSLSNIKIVDAKSDAIDMDFSKINLNNVIINGSGNDCLDFSYGNYYLKNIKLEKCGDKGISVGENSKIELNSANIKNAKIGIAVKDSSTALIGNILLADVETCFSAYKKKKEFNGGNIEINNMNCYGYKNLKIVDRNSRILIN